MKYLVGLIFATITVIILAFLNSFVVNHLIPQFMVGWIGCTGWFLGIRTYNFYHQKRYRNIFGKYGKQQG